MRKIWLFLVLLLLAAPALADNMLIMNAAPCEVQYEIALPGEKFAYVIFQSPQQQGRMVVFAENGQFAGTIPLTSSPEGGRVTVTIQSVELKQLARMTVDLPADSAWEAPQGNTEARVSNFTLEETPEGFRYAFTAPGADYMLLDCHSRQEDFVIPVYPVDDEGTFSGEVSMPLTYARTQMTISVCNAKGHVKKEAVCYKDFAAPEAAEGQPGRLSGVVVCIDPGHQENGRSVREPRGPGLTGESSGDMGMAMGSHTLRRESIVVLEIGLKLRDVLLAQGATVVMTRDRQDTFVSNMTRADIAAEAGAHMMLRLHCDYNDNRPNNFGVNIYCPQDSDYAKLVASREDYEHMGTLLMNSMKTAVGYDLIQHTGMVRLNNAYVGNNWAQMPCFLIEMGFMTNNREDLLLSQPVYQQWLAEGMADGVYEIAQFRGLIAE